MQREARICCLDLDTFFVSVERLFDPTLIGKPVVVGAAPGQRGVVCSASYEVRAFGVRSGMSTTEAERLAPHAIFVAPRHHTYSDFSKQVRAVLERYCPVVRPASIDEFFLDFSGCERLYGKPVDADGDATIERVVREMREAIQVEVHLPASVGIGTTRAIAKMASSRAKPAGVWLVRPGQEHEFVAPLAVRKYPGIGPVATARLNGAGIETLGQLLAVTDASPHVRLRTMVAHGIGWAGDGAPERERPAFREHDEPGGAEGSISNERTFSVDVGQMGVAADQLRALAERVTWRARKRGVLARTITLKLRYADFKTLTRARTIPATCEEGRILAVVLELLRKNWTRRKRLRLLGVALSNLVPPSPQLDLPFAAPPLQPRPHVGAAIDAVRAKFGYEAVRLGAQGSDREWLG